MGVHENKKSFELNGHNGNAQGIFYILQISYVFYK